MELTMIDKAAVALTALTLAVLLIPFLLYSYPQLVGASETFIAQADSMEPEISAGDAVFVKDVHPSEIQKGDIITYEEVDGELTITHRVVETAEFGQEYQFKTKGDNNQEYDGEWIPHYNVLGETVLVAPHLGVAAKGLNAANWIIILIIIPAVVLVINEFRKIAYEIL